VGLHVAEPHLPPPGRIEIGRGQDLHRSHGMSAVAEGEEPIPVPIRTQEIGDEDAQAWLRPWFGPRGEGPGEVGLARGGELHEGLERGGEGNPPPARGRGGDERVAERVDREPVLAAVGDEREGRGEAPCERGLVALPHRAACVEEQVQRCLHLVGECLRHQPPVAGVHGPVDEAEIVPWLIGAVVGELHGCPLAPCEVATGEGSPRPAEGDPGPRQGPQLGRGEGAIGHGTRTARAASSTSWPAATPSASARKLGMTRCTSAGRSAAWMSSTPTWCRPARNARPLAPRMRARLPRGLAPYWT